VKKKDQDRLCVLSDAKRNLVYAAIYEWKKDGPVRVSDFLLVELPNLLKQLHGKVVFTGDGLPVYQEEILKQGKRKASGFNAVCLDEKYWYPSAKEISRLAAVRLNNKDRDNINTLVPLYLYPQDCQVRR